MLDSVYSSRQALPLAPAAPIDGKTRQDTPPSADGMRVCDGTPLAPLSIGGSPPRKPPAEALTPKSPSADPSKPPPTCTKPSPAAPAAWLPPGHRAGKLLGVAVLVFTGGMPAAAFLFEKWLTGGSPAPTGLEPQALPSPAVAAWGGEDAWNGLAVMSATDDAKASQTPYALDDAPTFPPAQADPLASTVSALDKAGLHIYFAAEDHASLYKGDLVARLLNGLRGQGKVTLYRELNFGQHAESFRKYEKQCAAVTAEADRRSCQTFWMDAILPPMRLTGADSQTQAEAAQLRQALSANVTVRFLEFFVGEKDLGRALATPTRAKLLSLGISHATGYVVRDRGPEQLVFNPCAEILTTLPTGYRSPPLSRESQDDMFKGLARSNGKAGFTVSSSTFEKMDEVRRRGGKAQPGSHVLCKRYLENEGYASTDIQLPRYNVTLFAPKKYEAILRQEEGSVVTTDRSRPDKPTQLAASVKPPAKSTPVHDEA